MAGYGAKYPCFAPIATEPEGSLPTYGAGAYIGKLNLANLTVTLASGEAWGDDELAEQISEFASGSLAMETLDMEDNTASMIYGAQVQDGVVHYNSGDTPPLGGLGYYKVLMRNGKKYFQAIIYPKVRAALGNDNAQTKSSTITFTNTQTTFTIFAAASGDWRLVKTFDTEAAARAYIQTTLGIEDWHIVEIQTSGDGTATPDGSVFVADGESLEITFSANPSALYDNGASQTATANKYTIASVTGDHSVVAAFTA